MEQKIDRLRRVLELIPKHGKLLEIGSYPFIYTRRLVNKGYDVTGIDLNRTKEDLNIVVCDVEKHLPFKDKSYDIILFMEVLEHLGNNPIKALKEIHRVLKDDGIMILTTPNILRLENLYSIIRRGKQTETLKSIAQKETMDYIGHIREYSKNELKEILEYCKFETKHYWFEWTDCRPVRFFVVLFPWFSTNIIMVCKKETKK